MSKKQKKEFGDFQTPETLAVEAMMFIDTFVREPSFVIEPTCGLGSFLKAGIQQFGEKTKYYAFDINEQYIQSLHKSLNGNTATTCVEFSDFFEKDWATFFLEQATENILVIGNPPWVTNSALGVLKSKNLPKKSNFQKLKGLSAKTGKANFDIAEWMLITLIESLGKSRSCLAMLCKTSTARKVFKHLWAKESEIWNSSIHLIDAKKHFNVSVDACLFVTHIGKEKREKTASVYSDLSFKNKLSQFGMSGKELIANIDDYQQYNTIDGIDYYKWRSGLKHDASKVMELTKENGNYINGFGKFLKIENDYVYPLLKSSDLANNRLVPRKFVIVTQKNIRGDTHEIQRKAPNTWKYLEEYSEILNNRKSVIYKNRHKFSIFGIGDYSFSPWKVAISGMYKNIVFSVVGSISEVPIMLDDTCYFISCQSREEACFICSLLNSEISQKFLRSLIFFDSKRPLNIDILKRVDLKKIAEYYQFEEQSVQYLSNVQATFTQQQK